MTTMGSYRVLVGSDNAGADYKKAILADLEADPRVGAVTDVSVASGLADGCSYGEVGIAAGRAIMAGEADRAVLICGTGIGMAISANKVPGIRATTAHDCFSVERSILSNDCQVLTLGQRVIGLELARRLVGEWFGYVFDPSSHSAANVEVITVYEARADSTPR
ncbi:ribose 5-phosphate isomerase B [Nakamurella sp. UYEF19]|uniref:RpiB/LacA/LacB family sugar-phosphate isomerase n=1 Tax=Nakamurella sp. UYEF19 TaxID=1756392 RepID=UPI0033923E98